MTNQPKQSAIEKYLSELEVAAKQCVGVYPHQILRDAQEHLVRDHHSLLQAEPGLDEQAILEHFRQSYGDPLQVAKSYERFSETIPSEIPAYAPNWRIRCTKCGRSAPAAKIGITRIGARSIGKRVLGWCSGCIRLRWLSLTRDLNCPGTVEPHEGTLDTNEEHNSSNLMLKRIISVAWILAQITIVIVVISLLCVPLARASQASKSSKAPGLQKTPDGWEIVRDDEISGAQLTQISKKLGVPLRSLFNTVVRFDRKELQINTITTQTLGDAQQLKEILRKGKPNPRWIVQNEANVYEFVVRSADAARLASVARYAFAIARSKRNYELKFDAIPIEREEQGIAPDDRNQLFNLLIQAPVKPAMRGQIESLSKKFKFAPDFQLVKDLQGQVVVQWSSNNVEFVAEQGSESTRMKLKGAETKFGMPSVQLTAAVSIDTQHPRIVDSKFDTSALLSANSRFPTQSAELQAVVGQLIKAQDSDSIKLRKLLDWFADSKNFKYDGLVGSRYGTSVAFKQHFGRCWDYSDLFVTMARIAGLPARQVYGWLYESEGHVWCDVIVDGRWSMVDPTSGTIVGSDYIPICVSADGEFSILYSSQVQISEK